MFKICHSLPLTLAMAPSQDYYELLQIETSATEREVRKAYRKMSLRYHPDKVGDNTEAADKFQLLQVALALLTDPDTRRTYDQMREAEKRRAAEHAALEGRRKQMKEALEARESGGTVPGGKRGWDETQNGLDAREKEIGRIAEENRKRKEALIQKRKAAVAAAKVSTPEQNQPSTSNLSSEPMHPPGRKTDTNGVNDERGEDEDLMSKTVKLRWTVKANATSMNSAWMQQQFESTFGLVENVLMLKEKRARPAGRDTKVLMGTAMVTFVDKRTAEQAISEGPLSGLDSIEWAAP